MGNQGQLIRVETNIQIDQNLTSKAAFAVPRNGKGTGPGKGRGHAPTDADASDPAQQARTLAEENKQRQELELERKLAERSKELIEQGKLNFTQHTAATATEPMETVEQSTLPMQ